MTIAHGGMHKIIVCRLQWQSAIIKGKFFYFIPLPSLVTRVGSVLLITIYKPLGARCTQYSYGMNHVLLGPHTHTQLMRGKGQVLT